MVHRGVRSWTVIAAMSIAIAGCVDSAVPREDSVDGLQTPANVQAFQRGVNVPIPVHWSALNVSVVPTGIVDAEPTIGVLDDGTLFVSGDAGTVHRSGDDGRTWEDVTTPAAYPTDLDPWIWVDQDTDRVFNSPLYVPCAWLSWSDDAGRSWEVNPLGGCGTPLHHYQKLSTGPPPEDVSTDGYPNLVYYAASSLRDPDPENPSYLIVAGTGTWITASRDGGRTFPPATQAHPSTPGCPDSQGSPVAVAPDGTAYSAQNHCGAVRFAASSDGGVSWTVRAMLDEVGYLRFGADPALAVDRDGTVYLAYPGGDARTWVRHSTDGGRMWSDPVLVTPPDVEATMFTVVEVGAPGRVAMAYMGTSSDPQTWPSKDTSFAPDSAVWHLYLTFSDNVLADEPLFVTVRATPSDDPVQRGCIWMQGGSNECRNLADFIDVTQRHGRTYVAFTDGCLRCPSAAASRDRVVNVALVESGPSLLGGLVEPPS